MLGFLVLGEPPVAAPKGNRQVANTRVSRRRSASVSGGGGVEVTPRQTKMLPPPRLPPPATRAPAPCLRRARGGNKTAAPPK
ncbi:hypothetical protein MTO96_013321 [Rhipicephalus appendiculatus]